MPHYWDFSFVINNKDTGYYKEDRAVTCDLSDKFPILLVETWAIEEFGDNTEIRLINTTEISEMDYTKLVEKLGVATNV